MHTKNAERSDDEKLDPLRCSGIYTVSKRLSISKGFKQHNELCIFIGDFVQEQIKKELDSCLRK